MIDERHEELAALYALDLLEGNERASFESLLATDPALTAFTLSLREASSSLALTSPAAIPPAELRARVLATVAALPAAGSDSEKVIRPSAALFRSLIPWAMAACFGLSAAWLGQLYLGMRAEASLLRDGRAIAELTLKSTQQQLEAERILARRQILDTEQRLADNRTLLAQRDTQVAAQNQRIDALTGASAELGRQFGESMQRVATLTAQLKLEGDIANLKITALASKLANSPEAVAIAVWNPLKQEGTLKVEKLPALAGGQDYQLWIVDPQYPNPVDGGVFTVDPNTGDQRLTFKANQPVKSIAAFAVTLERKGGVPKAEGPFVLLGK
jgi:anti-sigma-K factor RskA